MCLSGQDAPSFGQCVYMWYVFVQPRCSIFRPICIHGCVFVKILPLSANVCTCGMCLSSQEAPSFGQCVYMGVCSSRFSLFRPMCVHVVCVCPAERLHLSANVYTCGVCSSRFSLFRPMCIHVVCVRQDSPSFGQCVYMWCVFVKILPLSANVYHDFGVRYSILRPGLYTHSHDVVYMLLCFFQPDMCISMKFALNNHIMFWYSIKGLLIVFMKAEGDCV